MNKIIFLFGVLILIFTVADSGFSQETKANPVVVMLDKGPPGFVTKINSKKIPDKELLLTLSQMWEEEPERESILLIHESASFSMLKNLLGIMRKAGYVHPKVLFFSRDRDWMVEITISGAIPFSDRGMQKK